MGTQDSPEDPVQGCLNELTYEHLPSMHAFVYQASRWAHRLLAQDGAGSGQ